MCGNTLFRLSCAGQVLQPRFHRAGGAAAGAGAEEVGGSAAARVTVVAPLPLLLATVETPDCTVVPPPAPVEVRPASACEVFLRTVMEAEERPFFIKPDKAKQTACFLSGSSHNCAVH